MDLSLFRWGPCSMDWWRFTHTKALETKNSSTWSCWFYTSCCQTFCCSTTWSLFYLKLTQTCSTREDFSIKCSCINTANVTWLAFITRSMASWWSTRPPFVLWTSPSCCWRWYLGYQIMCSKMWATPSLCLCSGWRILCGSHYSFVTRSPYCLSPISRIYWQLLGRPKACFWPLGTLLYGYGQVQYSLSFS